MAGYRRMGGISALIMAATFLVGFAVFGTVLVPAGYFEPDIGPSEKAALVADNQAALSIGYLISYVVFGIFLVVLALALHGRLQAGAGALAQVATAFGLIWAGLVIASGMVANIGIGTAVELFETDPAQAGSVWLAIEAVQLGLGGQTEIVGGLWILLVSLAALRGAVLSKTLNYLGVLIGASGLLTLIPALEALGPVFGLALIIWFVWLGILLTRRQPRAQG